MRRANCPRPSVLVAHDVRAAVEPALGQSDPSLSAQFADATFKRDADGGLTLLTQNESPSKDKEANWLPAPKGPFFVAMRLYWPKAEALEGKWIAPPLKRSP